MRRNAEHLLPLDPHRIDLYFREEGLVLPMIDERLQWCAEHCRDDFAAHFDHDLGFQMLFVDPNDAIEFKLRWY